MSSKLPTYAKRRNFPPSDDFYNKFDIRKRSLVELKSVSS